MGTRTTFHAPGNGADFLGWRVGRNGATEIVYEDGASHRLVWRVLRGGDQEDALSEALELAVQSRRVVPRMMDELKKRAIDVESRII